MGIEWETEVVGGNPIPTRVYGIGMRRIVSGYVCRSSVADTATILDPWHNYNRIMTGPHQLPQHESIIFSNSINNSSDVLLSYQVTTIN